MDGVPTHLMPLGVRLVYLPTYLPSCGVLGVSRSEKIPNGIGKYYLAVWFMFLTMTYEVSGVVLD